MNAIEIRGDPDRIFELAAEISEWPRILPHYRYVVIEEDYGSARTARMGAMRGRIPVKWRALQELLPEQRRIRFRHIGGITKGMDVEWRIEPGADAASVSIHHELTYPIPLLRPLFAEYVVGRLFVQNIAGKTLRCIKQIAESEASAKSSSPASAP